jgi:hypothetical protein
VDMEAMTVLALTVAGGEGLADWAVRVHQDRDMVLDPVTKI